MKNKRNIKMVDINTIVNPWGGDKRVLEEVKRAQENYSDHPKEIVCKKCSKTYQPYPYQSIYYSLCDVCFKAFDKQKMDGRTAYFNDRSKGIRHFENVADWIKQGSS